MIKEYAIDSGPVSNVALQTSNETIQRRFAPKDDVEFARCQVETLKKRAALSARYAKRQERLEKDHSFAQKIVEQGMQPSHSTTAQSSGGAQRLGTSSAAAQPSWIRGTAGKTTTEHDDDEDEDEIVVGVRKQVVDKEQHALPTPTSPTPTFGYLLGGKETNDGSEQREGVFSKGKFEQIRKSEVDVGSLELQPNRDNARSKLRVHKRKHERKSSNAMVSVKTPPTPTPSRPPNVIVLDDTDDDEITKRRLKQLALSREIVQLKQEDREYEKQELDLEIENLCKKRARRA